MVDLSIIIVNYNGRDMLLACLESIAGHPPASSYEILVVDNGSTDGSAAAVLARFPDVELIQNESNAGFATANNQGIRASNGRYLLLLNNDTIVLPNTLDAMVEFMDAHPEVGLSGCRILNPDYTLQPSTYGSLSVAKTFYRLYGLRRLVPKGRFWRRTLSSLPLRLQRYFPGYWEHDTVREVQSVMGAFFFMRREAVEEAGLLDESMFMYNEEGEWAYRARAAGWKVFFVPVTGIIHYGGPYKARKAFQPDLFVEKHRGLLYIFQKHHPACEFAIARWLVISSFVCKILFWYIAWPLTPNRSRERVNTYKRIIAMAYAF